MELAYIYDLLWRLRVRRDSIRMLSRSRHVRELSLP